MACSTEPAPALDVREFAYAETTRSDCAPGTRNGGAGATNDWRPAGAPVVRVRSPVNYRADIAHPLLLVFAAAGQSSRASERFVALTASATSRGYVVAYPPSRRLNLGAIRGSHKLVDAVAAHWCIDTRRVVVAGHSDGGTIATALAVLPDMPARPAAILASASGFRASDLEQYDCPAPRPALILGQAGDTHFPGYARESAEWLATCAGCPLEAEATPGCWATNCQAGSVRYCESNGTHSQWPALNGPVEALLDHVAGLASGSRGR